MNRIIKFRVWDKKQKKMLPVSHLHFGDDGSGKTVTMRVKNEQGYERDLVMGENAELVEITGYLDKHGKDIYEGDIVKAEWHWTEPHVIEWPRDEYNFTEYGLYHAPIDILGNIYENPELLKEPQ